VSADRWARVPLSALCAKEDDIRCGPFGTQLSRDEFRSEGVPLWGIKHVNSGFRIATTEFLEPRTAERLAAYDLRPGDVVMTRKGTIGNCAIYPAALAPGVMHSDLLRLRVEASRCDARFLVHQLHSSPDVENQLSSMSTGAIMPGINVGRLKALEVWLPPVPEQRRIAEILDKADALRTKRRAALAQLDTLTQSIFLDMFGDPIENPRKLPVRPLKELVDPSRPISYGILKPGPEEPGGVKYVRVVDMQDGGIHSAGARRTAPAISDAYRRSLLNAGDLLLSIRGHVGRVAAVPPELAGANITQDTARLAVVGADPAFVLECLRSPPFQRWMAKHTKGIAVRGINLADVKAMPIAIPDPDSQRRFARAAAHARRLQSVAREALAQADSLFSSLQHRAFRGEL
jgi:type I restriction enzyme, S subunit